MADVVRLLAFAALQRQRPRTGVSALHSENLGNHAVDIGFGGAVIYDAGAQAEFTAQGCVGEIHAASLDDTLEDGSVELIEFVF